MKSYKSISITISTNNN